MSEIIDSLIQFASDRSGLAASLGLFACAFIATLCKVIDTAINVWRRNNLRAQATSDALTAMARVVQRVNKQSADRTAALRSQSEASEYRAQDAIAELRHIVDRQREYSNSIKRHRRNWETQQRAFQAHRSSRQAGPFQLSDPPVPDGDR